MQEGQLLMTQADRDRLVTLRKAKKRLITQQQAAEELRLSVRQVKRLVFALKKRGDKAVIHGLRGKPSNQRIARSVEDEAIQILSADLYQGFGPTLAAEYLADKHDIEVSKETLRQWMIRAKLWRAKDQKVKAVHVWRPRRSRFGELVQWDTSEHDWLEGRGEKLYLIAMIDDATSRVVAGFARHDSTEENLRLLGRYLCTHGRLLAVYTDKASLFQTVPKGVHHRQAPAEQPTQIGRALHELGIEWIAAQSPQAKGRIERFFGTAQDRLVKGLRKVGASTLEQANEYLGSTFLPLWERRFSQEPRQAGDAHRQMDASLDLDSRLSRVEARRVAQDYTVRWQGEIYQIPRSQIGGGMRGSQVEVEKRLDGSVWMRWKQRRVRLDPCPLAGKANYRVARVTTPAAVAKPDAAERQRRRVEARRKAEQAFCRLPDRPLWQVLRDEAR